MHDIISIDSLTSLLLTWIPVVFELVLIEHDNNSAAGTNNRSDNGHTFLSLAFPLMKKQIALKLPFEIAEDDLIFCNVQCGFFEERKEIDWDQRLSTVFGRFSKTECHWNVSEHYCGLWPRLPEFPSKI